MLCMQAAMNGSPAPLDPPSTKLGEASWAPLGAAINKNKMKQGSKQKVQEQSDGMGERSSAPVII